jgi:hypothetical protein
MKSFEQCDIVDVSSTTNDVLEDCLVDVDVTLAPDGSLTNVDDNYLLEITDRISASIARYTVFTIYLFFHISIKFLLFRSIKGSNAFPMKVLRIIEGKYCWKLYIDLQVICSRLTYIPLFCVIDFNRFLNSMVIPHMRVRLLHL